MTKDLRFGWRMLWRNPGFTVMAALALALGIGANTAIFSVVNAVMLERMPFQNPDGLAMVWEASPRTGKPNVVNPTNFLRWQERNHSFERMAAFGAGSASLTGEGEPEVVPEVYCTADYFPILGVKPLMGRWFEPGEDTRGKSDVAILSEQLWRRRFGADPNILGKTVRVDGTADKVIGVMPAEFKFPKAPAELWEPLVIRRDRDSGGRSLSVVARMKPGAKLTGAQAEMDVIARQLQVERPTFDAKWGIDVIGLREDAIGDVRTPLLVLLGAAGRSREIAVRAALGAGAMRIARQLLIESVMLSAIGGMLGLLFGLGLVRVLAKQLPDTIASSNLENVEINLTVFLFTLAISIGTGVLFGLVPAIKAARADVQVSLKEGGRGVAGGRSFGRSALVVAEVALSMILLIGAGLLIRSFYRLAGVDPGFDAKHVISMKLAAWSRFKTPDQLVAFTRQMLDRVRALPGVEAAGSTHFLPLAGMGSATFYYRADRPRPEHGAEPVADVALITPGYFAAMNTPIVRGRAFDDRDGKGAPPTVVIDQTAAREFYPNEDPIGKLLTVAWDHPDQPYEIVGVVANIHQRGLAEKERALVFLSMAQAPTTPLVLVTRTHGDPRLAANAIQAQIHALDHDMPVYQVKTLDDVVSNSVAEQRFDTTLLAGFAALALLLAAVGIFGVISYSVAQRTQEIGIRRALGADTANVLQLVLNQALGLTAAGLAIGIAGAFAVTRLIQALLFQVTPTDPLTFAAVAIVLSAVALIASYLPARRAAKVDPMVALRYE
ncbi:MAG TPA: ABC transporter permease [Bryobacteraceae bacterium]|nr:ABC transporter permease [Bryobacteraceae bacterium]